MEKLRDGNVHIFKAPSRKPPERLRADVSQLVMRGWSGLAAVHRWRGNTLHISSVIGRGTVTLENDCVVSRIHFYPWFWGFREKILADIEGATREAAGIIPADNRHVFVVHGHNVAAREELRAILYRLHLKPVILEDQDDRGLTIIEKFEYYASSCSFAVILMTPDDMTTGSRDIDSKWRARQNVIMELGWFMARLGRERVVILYQGQLEIPSDILGVVYLKFQEHVKEVEGKLTNRLKGVGMLI